MVLLLTTDKPGRNQMVAIASLRDAGWSKAELELAFGKEEAETMIALAEQMECLERERSALRFTMPIEKITKQGLVLPMLVRPFYHVWNAESIINNELDQLYLKLSAILTVSDEEYIAFLLQIGGYAEKRRNLPLATAIYRDTTVRSKKIENSNVRKKLVVRSVLNISRIEFMRGVSPRKTLKCQQEALRMVHQQNLSAEDALLMIYTGMSEHFCGSTQEGTTLRETGLKYLKEFNYSELEAEVVPLEGWHYYLKGNFANTIAHYESLTLAIENRKDIELVAFAYPPIIFSYMFLGEYHKALTLAEILHHNAQEKHDHYAATLMLANIGRVYTYKDDLEKAETVLYQAYAEALQQDYGWGLYYTSLGLCYLHYKKENHFACRESLLLALKAAQDHGFNPISASPFIFDALKMIRDRGMEPIQGMTFESELQDGLASQNVHMAGVAYRFQALQCMETGRSPDEIINSLKTSIKLLEDSGSGNQLGQTYLTCARFYRDLSQEDTCKKYAQLAYSVQTSDERKSFPRDLAGCVVTNNYQVNLASMLEALWLELRHIINAERLIARLMTTMCRQLQVESGAFLVKQEKTQLIYLAQNVDKDPKSAQYQRIVAISTYVEHEGKIFTSQNADRAVVSGLDLRQSPRFCVCIPFYTEGRIGAMLYLESYYREDAISRNELQLLDQFAKKLASHLFAILEQDDRLDGKVNNNSKTYGTTLTGKIGGYCQSVDETVLILQTQIEKVARTKVPILLTGETGVGKEVFCSEIYEKSGCQGPYIKVNCGAIPETLIESELFGYERGSFTGASSQKKGYFELANKGTLFLDEIGELTLQAQVKLLRVLQEQEFIRVGGTRPVKVDFRLIAATNKDLKAEVEKGTFRKDLYYRLNVIQFVIPPLRERKSDISNMAHYFANKYCREMNCSPCQFSEDALVWMLDYDWPGNVRELENVVQRAVLLAEGNIITKEILFQKKNSSISKPEPEKLVTLEEMERRYILKVLRACNGRIAGSNGAAEILGMKRTTLNSKMERLGIRNMLVLDSSDTGLTQ